MTFRAELLLRAVRAWFWRYGAERWARGAVAKKADGTPCDPLDREAKSYSVVGALDRVLFEYGWRSSFVPEPGALARTYVLEACVFLCVDGNGVRLCRDDAEAPHAVDAWTRKLTVEELLAFIDAGIKRGVEARERKDRGEAEPVVDREAFLDSLAERLKSSMPKRGAA